MNLVKARGGELLRRKSNRRRITTLLLRSSGVSSLITRCRERKDALANTLPSSWERGAPEGELEGTHTATAEPRNTTPAVIHLPCRNIPISYSQRAARGKQAKAETWAVSPRGVERAVRSSSCAGRVQWLQHNRTEQVKRSD